MNSAEKNLLSVITVVFNAEKQVETLLNSIAVQKDERIEFIVIDGGSTDQTPEILKKYAAIIDVLVSEKDSGIYDAMNKGISLASGKWLYFIGSDDKLADNVLNDFLLMTAQSDAELVYGDFIEVTPDGKKIYRAQSRITAKYQMLKGCLNHQSVFFSKKLFEKYGVYNTGYRLSADFDFFTRIPFHVYSKALKLPFPVAYYNNNGLSGRSKEKVYKERRSIIGRNFGRVTGWLYELYLAIKKRG